MSFHGGMIGVAVAIAVFCRRIEIPVLGFADRVAACAPIGLFLGRIANFINGELWGRPAPLWWPGAMVFPNAIPATNPPPSIYEALRNTVCAGLDPTQCIPRYPSELYEAFMEGLILFLVMLMLSRRESLRAALRLADRRLPGGLRHRPHHLRVLPRPGLLPALPGGGFRPEHGADPVYPDAGRRHRSDLVRRPEPRPCAALPALRCPP